MSISFFFFLYSARYLFERINKRTRRRPRLRILFCFRPASRDTPVGPQTPRNVRFVIVTPIPAGNKGDATRTTGTAAIDARDNRFRVATPAMLKTKTTSSQHQVPPLSANPPPSYTRTSQSYCRVAKQNANAIETT